MIWNNNLYIAALPILTLIGSFSAFIYPHLWPLAWFLTAYSQSRFGAASLPAYSTWRFSLDSSRHLVWHPLLVHKRVSERHSHPPHRRPSPLHEACHPPGPHSRTRVDVHLDHGDPHRERGTLFDVRSHLHRVIREE